MRIGTLARFVRSLGFASSLPHRVLARPRLCPLHVTPISPRPSLRYFSVDSNSAHHRLLEEGIPAGINEEQGQKFIEQAIAAWPAPPRIPKGGWSSSWEHWPYLLTFYWSSPFYLMIPQIEMIVNILHGLPGNTRPLLFSNSRNQFVFTLSQSESESELESESEEHARFLLFDVGSQTLSEFEGVKSEEELISRMDEDPDVLPLHALVPDAEGQSAIQRIMERDETVIPLLAERFLDYTPRVTHPWQEIPVEAEMFKIWDLVEEKVEQAMEGGKTELTNEEQSEIAQEVISEFERRRAEGGWYQQ